jgi:hypothetical protein
MDVTDIPKNIFFYYTGNPVCDNLKLNISNFKECNKNFNVTLITDDTFILDLAKKDFPNIYFLFNKITIPSCKSDIFRVLYLYYCGGIYVDCNIIPIKSFDEFYEKNKHFDFIISYNYMNNDFSTRILFSKPLTSILYNVLEVMQRNLINLYEKEIMSKDRIEYNILVLTGTYPFYEILGRNNENKINGVTFFDDYSDIVRHYGCRLISHIDFKGFHWSEKQKTQKLFK